MKKQEIVSFGALLLILLVIILVLFSLDKAIKMKTSTLPNNLDYQADIYHIIINKNIISSDSVTIKRATTNASMVVHGGRVYCDSVYSIDDFKSTDWKLITPRNSIRNTEK